MKTAALLLMLSLSVFAPPPAEASDGNPPTPTRFSIDDFDWREMVPSLLAASTLPGEQGVKAILENCKVLRSYLAVEVMAECRPGNNRCDSSREGFTVTGEITKRIDGIVREGMVRRHKSSFVDYAFDGHTFPFSAIAAIRSDKPGDAYLILQLPSRSYTAADLHAKYGDPYDTDIFQQFSVFKYRMSGPGYTSRAVFEVDPTDGAVLKVAISLKARKQQ